MRYLALGLSLALLSAVSLEARTPKWVCRLKCAQVIGHCIETGERSIERCTRFYRKQCRRFGVGLCQIATTSTTTSTSTTTTTMPGPLLLNGAYYFSGVPVSDTCGAIYEPLSTKWTLSQTTVERLSVIFLDGHHAQARLDGFGYYVGAVQFEDDGCLVSEAARIFRPTDENAISTTATFVLSVNCGTPTGCSVQYDGMMTR